MTAATRTAVYSETHRAILLAARERNLRPYEVRLLLALHDRGGSGRTDQLEEDLCEDQGTAIRRASIKLRSRRFISGAAADGSGQIKRGVRMSFVLTKRGHRCPSGRGMGCVWLAPIDPLPKVRLREGPSAHFYVKPPGGDAAWSPCARDGCGLPPAHPVHLRPTGDDERAAATG